MRSKYVVLVLCFGLNLISCGGSGGQNSDIGELENNSELDPYIGDWKRDCSVVDEYWIFNQLPDDIQPIYHEVYLSVSATDLEFSMHFYEDQSCTQLSSIDSSGWFIDQGGEIAEKVDLTTSENYSVSSYSVPLRYFGNTILFPFHNVDDRLYIVDVDTELLPSYPNSADMFRVDFNNYYQRR